MKYLVVTLLVVVLAFGFLFGSCKKAQKTEEPTTEQVMEDTTTVAPDTTVVEGVTTDTTAVH